MMPRAIWSMSTSRSSAGFPTGVGQDPRASTGQEERWGESPGYWYVHNAIDCIRLGYSELLEDERKETAAEFWLRANA